MLLMIIMMMMIIIIIIVTATLNRKENPKKDWNTMGISLETGSHHSTHRSNNICMEESVTETFIYYKAQETGIKLG